MIWRSIRSLLFPIGCLECGAVDTILCARCARCALLAPHLPDASVLVPLRTTRRRAGQRGFDQAVLLAKKAGGLRSLVVADVLVKRPGPPQQSRSRRQRLAMGERYTIRTKIVPSAAVLIDDVCTTGASLERAATSLERAGTRVVGAYVIAWAAGDAHGTP